MSDTDNRDEERRAKLVKAGVAVGADGLIIEVHPRPEEALCDGAQALTPGQYAVMVEQLQRIHALTVETIEATAVIS